jgi:N-acetylglutamate synthase-like GNAT family acetyltransferase
MDEFSISQEFSDMDVNWIHRYLSEHSYWAKGRSLETVIRSIQHSQSFGLFDKNKKQVGFARVITDSATFAYLCDVFLDESVRNHGLGQSFLERILNDSRFATVQWFLRTTYSQSLYQRLGFKSLDNLDGLMIKKPLSIQQDIEIQGSLTP